MGLSFLHLGRRRFAPLLFLYAKGPPRMGTTPLGEPVPVLVHRRRLSRHLRHIVYPGSEPRRLLALWNELGVGGRRHHVRHLCSRRGDVEVGEAGLH